MSVLFEEDRASDLAALQELIDVDYAFRNQPCIPGGAHPS